MNTFLGLLFFAIVLFAGIAVWLPIYKKLWIKIMITVGVVFGFTFMCCYCSTAVHKNIFTASADYIRNNEITCWNEAKTYSEQSDCMWTEVHDMSQAISNYELQF